MNIQELEAKKIIEEWFKDREKTIQIAEIRILANRNLNQFNIEYSIGGKMTYLIDLTKDPAFDKKKIDFLGNAFDEIWEKAKSGNIIFQNKLVDKLIEINKNSI